MGKLRLILIIIIIHAIHARIHPIIIILLLFEVDVSTQQLILIGDLG